MGTAVRALVAVAGVATLLLAYAGKQQAVEAMRRTGVPRAPDRTRVETGRCARARWRWSAWPSVLVALLVHRRQRWRRPDDA